MQTYWKHILTICFIYLPLSSFSQVRFEDEKVYKFSQSILNNLNSNANPNYWKAATDFSFIGDHKNALKYGGKNRQPYYELSQKDSLYFTHFHAANARKYILEKAKDEQVIMINEAHHFPFHRVFITTLLKDLYELGFNFYGAETINLRDTALNNRGYPLIKSGYYTVEPQFGNLVRKAINLGYEVFAYEVQGDESFQNPKKREIEQAKNIQQVLNENPDAKILIHAGYSHIREDSLGGKWEKAMAARFKEFTGIDPFTINQEILTERVRPDLENPYYRMIDIEKPSVFIDDNGNVFAGPEGTNYYDLRLAHPRTRYIKNRPHWLLYDDRKHVTLNEKQLSVGFPCLVQVYNIDENTDHAVPVDVVEIVDAQNKKALVLKPGDYFVVVKSQHDKKEFPLKVKE